MDGPSPGLLGGGSWLCFKHPVVRCPMLGTDLRSSAVLTPLLLPTVKTVPVHVLSLQNKYGTNAI